MAISDGAATAAPARSEEARTYLGSVLRITVEFMRERGCLEAIRKKVSPKTLALIDKPPFPLAWIPAAAMDDLESALLSVSGQQHADLFDLLALRRVLPGARIGDELRV